MFEIILYNLQKKFNAIPLQKNLKKLFEKKIKVIWKIKIVKVKIIKLLLSWKEFCQLSY
jgi:hypothetical protein